MLELDRTKSKEKLGANAILGVSMAAADAAAKNRVCHLFVFGGVGSMPMMNILNGGEHADNSVIRISHCILQVQAFEEVFQEDYSIGVGDAKTPEPPIRHLWHRR